ncbi:hypothetical protein PUN28_002757 [Cardiocondyla obscurior]|uniref:Uncharacterized protein n=1 Tax=Cardiocondyla obscurior TaxID=286306 RepID=A0AAW2GVZ5_9HYME
MFPRDQKECPARNLTKDPPSFSALPLVKQFQNANKWNINNNVSFHFAGGGGLWRYQKRGNACERKLLENATVQYAKQTSASPPGVSLLAYTYIYV